MKALLEKLRTELQVKIDGLTAVTALKYIKEYNSRYGRNDNYLSFSMTRTEMVDYIMGMDSIADVSEWVEINS